MRGHSGVMEFFANVFRGCTLCWCLSLCSSKVATCGYDAIVCLCGSNAVKFPASRQEIGFQKQAQEISPEVLGSFCKFFVMRAVEGRSLRKVLECNQMTADMQKQIFEHIYALVYTHGILHNDLHVDNIIIEDTGRVWIIDYGDACYIAEAPLGLKWRDRGPVRPERGTEICSQALVEAIRQWPDFTTEEFACFGLDMSELQDAFALVDGHYFRPENNHALDEAFSKSALRIIDDVRSVCGAHPNQDGSNEFGVFMGMLQSWDTLRSGKSFAVSMNIRIS